MNEHQLFGPASTCQSLQELISLAQCIVGDEARCAITAYGMLLGARSAPVGDYRESALGVLNSLGVAKMELDKSSCHTEPTVMVTAAMLSAAQKFVDEMTIPCTEWPTSTEVVTYVAEFAARYAYAGPWRRTLLGQHGQVIGLEVLSTR